MIKKKKRKQKRKGDKTQEIIGWIDGRDRIVKLGLNRFLNDVDDIYEPPSWTDVTSIPQQAYIATYDTIFTLCIQPEPYNYSQQLYELHGDILSEYYKKEMMKENMFKSIHNKTYLNQWLMLYEKCMLIIDGMTRYFMYLDRFYVANNDYLDITSLNGIKLFFKHVFDIKFPLILDKLIECINFCRDDFIDNNHYFHDEYKWLITGCVHTVKSLNDRARSGILFVDDKKTELLVFGYVAEFEKNINEFIVPTQIVELLLVFTGKINIDIFDVYFYDYFINDSYKYYLIKTMKLMNNSNITKTQYLIKCKNIIQYEMKQMINWNISYEKKVKFNQTLCKMLYNKIMPQNR